MEPEPPFWLEPELEPTQYGRSRSRSRLRDLDLPEPEPPKKVAAPQHCFLGGVVPFINCTPGHQAPIVPVVVFMWLG